METFLITSWTDDTKQVICLPFVSHLRNCPSLSALQTQWEGRKKSPLRNCLLEQALSLEAFPSIAVLVAPLNFGCSQWWLLGKTQCEFPDGDNSRPCLCTETHYTFSFHLKHVRQVDKAGAQLGVKNPLKGSVWTRTFMAGLPGNLIKDADFKILKKTLDILSTW